MGKKDVRTVFNICCFCW